MSNDEQEWAMILGGLIGARLAAPKPQDKQELQEYRNLKQLLALRSQRLGNLPSLELLRSKSQYYNVFIEAYNSHLYGFFRSSSILCASLIESLLKEKYQKKTLAELIEEAKTQNLISVGEYHYLHGLRCERNNIVHAVFNEVKEEDSALILRMTIKLLDKILKC